MPTLILEPTQIEAAGNKPKIIRELIGRVNTDDPTVSVAYMQSPAGWEEPGQRPQFQPVRSLGRSAAERKRIAATTCRCAKPRPRKSTCRRPIDFVRRTDRRDALGNQLVLCNQR